MDAAAPDVYGSAMTQHFHVVVWLDHREAHVFGFNWDAAEEQLVRHKDASHQVHNKADPSGPGHEHEGKIYLSAVAAAIRDAGEILIVGPGTVKSEFKHYLDAHERQIAAKIVGVEPMDHPTDGELVNFARKYFRAKDHMTPQRVPPQHKPG